MPQQDASSLVFDTAWAIERVRASVAQYSTNARVECGAMRARTSETVEAVHRSKALLLRLQKSKRHI